MKKQYSYPHHKSLSKEELFEQLITKNIGPIDSIERDVFEADPTHKEKERYQVYESYARYLGYLNEWEFLQLALCHLALKYLRKIRSKFTKD